MGYVTEDGLVLSDELLDALASEYEEGSWEGGLSNVANGRPRLYDEDMRTVSLRLPQSRFEALEEACQSEGVSKSDFIRSAIEERLLRQASKKSIGA